MVNLQMNSPQKKTNKFCVRLVHFEFLNGNSATQNGIRTVICPTCLYACLTMLRHAPDETTDGVLQVLEQGITEPQESLRCNLAVAVGPKHSVPKVFYWIWSGEHEGRSMVTDHPSGTACILSSRGRTLLCTRTNSGHTATAWGLTMDSRTSSLFHLDS